MQGLGWIAFGVPGADEVGDDVQELTDSATSAWATFLDSLPRIGIGLVVLAVFALAGRFLRPVFERRLNRRRTPSFARVMAHLMAVGLVLVGGLIAMAIVFPSVQIVDLLAGAGVLSIAIGFAFKDILQNLIAGLLLLFRQPFRGGDQITVGDVSGTVVEINVRETILTTYSGHTVLIPNATVYTDMIDVQTTTPVTRDEVRVGVGYDADLETARAVVAEAVDGLGAVVADPPVEVLVAEYAASAIELDVLFWADAHQLENRRARSDVMLAVTRSLADAGIEIPYEIVTLRSPT